METIVIRRLYCERLPHEDPVSEHVNRIRNRRRKKDSYYFESLASRLRKEVRSDSIETALREDRVQSLCRPSREYRIKNDQLSKRYIQQKSVELRLYRDHIKKVNLSKEIFLSVVRGTEKDKALSQFVLTQLLLALEKTLLNEQVREKTETSYDGVENVDGVQLLLKETTGMKEILIGDELNFEAQCNLLMMHVTSAQKAIEKYKMQEIQTNTYLGFEAIKKIAQRFSLTGGVSQSKQSIFPFFEDSSYLFDEEEQVNVTVQKDVIAERDTFSGVKEKVILKEFVRETLFKDILIERGIFTLISSCSHLVCCVYLLVW